VDVEFLVVIHVSLDPKRIYEKMKKKVLNWGKNNIAKSL
jgi:hypothetical protein